MFWQLMNWFSEFKEMAKQLGAVKKNITLGLFFRNQGTCEKK